MNFKELAEAMITLYESVENKNDIENITSDFIINLNFNKKYKIKFRLELLESE